MRMYVNNAKSHSQAIRVIHDFLRQNENTRAYYNKDMKDYLEAFELKAKKGYFEELKDVSLFYCTGTDSAGFNLYVRFRGSTRNENVHQKMATAIGPWSIGAEMGHFLLLLICYRYNISVGRKRNAEHDFGHPWLQFIDHVQTRIQQIYNCIIYPRHFNLHSFRPIRGFQSIGIGPLCLSEDCIETREPGECLTGDMRFIANKMKVKYPPMPVGTVREKEIFNQFIRSNQAHSAPQWRNLVCTYHQKSDGISIFPKLPSMLKMHHTKWKQNQRIRLNQTSLGKVYDELILSLVANRATASTATRNPTSVCQQNILIDAPTLNVPPVVAPTQLELVDTKSIQQKHRRCFYWPLCKANVGSCGGWRKEKCMYRLRFCDVPDLLLEEMKRVERNKIKAERKRQSKISRIR